MAECQAIYVSADEFTVSGDQASEFAVSRAVQLLQGVDGNTETHVSAVEYRAGTDDTLVTTTTEVVTSNLATVKVGSSIPKTLPIHLHGSEPDGGFMPASVLNEANVSALLAMTTVSSFGGVAIQASGTNIQTSGTVQFANSNKFTFGLTGGQITASFSESTHAHDFAGVSHIHGSLVLTNISGTSLSNGLSLSVAPPGEGVALKGSGTFTQNTGTVEFVASNNFTFGLTQNSMTVSFLESTHAHDFAATNHTHGNLALTNITGTSASNGLSLSAADPLSVSAGLSAVSFGGNIGTTNSSSVGSGGFFMAGGSNITLSQSDNSISIHGGATGGGFALKGSGTFTQNTGTIEFVASNNFTFGLVANSMTASFSESTHAHDFAATSHNHGALALTNVSGTSASSGLSLSFDAASVSAGLSALTLGGNTGTTGSSSIGSGGFLLAGGSNITLSQSNNSISIHGASGGTGAGATFSLWHPFEPVEMSTSAIYGSSATSAIFPIMLPQALAMDHAKMFLNFGVASTSFATSQTTSFSHQNTTELDIHFYTRGTGVSSNLLEYVTSISGGISHDFTMSAGETGSNCSFTSSLQFYNGSVLSSSSATFSEAINSIRFFGLSTMNITGGRFVCIPADISLSPGNYWIAHNIKTGGAGNGPAGMTNHSVAMSGVIQALTAVPQPGISWPYEYGQNVTLPLLPGLGSVSNINGASLSAIELSNVSIKSYNPKQYFQFMRVA